MNDFWNIPGLNDDDYYTTTNLKNRYQAIPIWRQYRVSAEVFFKWSARFKPEWTYETEESTFDKKKITSTYFKPTKQKIFYKVEDYSDMMYNDITMEYKPSTTFHVIPIIEDYWRIIECVTNTTAVGERKEEVGW